MQAEGNACFISQDERLCGNCRQHKHLIESNVGLRAAAQIADALSTALCHSSGANAFIVLHPKAWE